MAFGSVKVIDALTLKPVGSGFAKMDGGLMAGALSSDGSLLATVDRGFALTDGRLSIWSVESGERKLGPLGLPSRAKEIRFDSNDALLAISTIRGVDFINVTDGRAVGGSLAASGYDCPFDVHPTKPLVLTGDSDGIVQLWDQETRQPIGPAMLYGDGRPAWVGLTEDADTAMAAYENGIVMAWNIRPANLPQAEPDRARWLELLTGLDLTGDREPLFLDSRRRWGTISTTFKERVRAEYNARSLESHKFFASQATWRHHWFAAAFHARWLNQSEPNNTDNLKTWGKSAAECEHWDEALVAFTNLCRLEPQSRRTRLRGHWSFLQRVISKRCETGGRK